MALKDTIQGNLEKSPMVLPVERLQSDVDALKKRTALAAAHRVRLRVHDILMALYLICDASGAEFGSTIIKDKGVLYESRTWTTD